VKGRLVRREDLTAAEREAMYGLLAASFDLGGPAFRRHAPVPTAFSVIFRQIPGSSS
jgi:hypothetical protein